MPALSIARTAKVCGPSARPVRVSPLAQAEKAPPSRLHSNEATPEATPPLVGSLPVKLKVAFALLLSAGGLPVIVVSGAVRSIVQVYEAGVVSMLPAASTARTRKVWLPSARPLRFCGLVQVANAAPSRLHSKRATALPVPLPVNVKFALVLLLAAGGVTVKAVSGSTVSTVKVFVFESTLTLPAASLARARTVCEPLASGTVGV